MLVNRLFQQVVLLYRLLRILIVCVMRLTNAVCC